MTELKGLRFEVLNENNPLTRESWWRWVFVGADGPVAESPDNYATEADARSAVATAKKRFKACMYAKVISIDKRRELT